MKRQWELDYFRKAGMNRAKLLLPSIITMVISGVLCRLSHGFAAFYIVYLIALVFLCVNCWYLFTVDDINSDIDRKAHYEKMKRLYGNP